jgi:hypothetical protein
MAISTISKSTSRRQTPRSSSHNKPITLTLKRQLGPLTTSALVEQAPIPPPSDTDEKLAPESGKPLYEGLSFCATCAGTCEAGSDHGGMPA